CGPSAALFPYTTLFRSTVRACFGAAAREDSHGLAADRIRGAALSGPGHVRDVGGDRPRRAMSARPRARLDTVRVPNLAIPMQTRSEEHTSELQSPYDLV